MTKLGTGDAILPHLHGQFRVRRLVKAALAEELRREREGKHAGQSARLRLEQQGAFMGQNLINEPAVYGADDGHEHSCARVEGASR